MLGDLTEKVQGSQSKFEKLVSRVPGYSGYKQKEQRREADKLLRLHVARQYEEQLSRLNTIAYDLTSKGRIAAIMPVERATTKLQTLIDRIKTASYGYSGLFDAVKVDEAALDKLYDFDSAMLDGVGQVKTLLDTLADAVASGAAGTAEAQALVMALETLNSTFSHRQDVILE